MTEGESELTQLKNNYSRKERQSLIKANGLRLSLNVCCKADLSALASGDSIRCEKEDDEEYQRLVFEAKEGDRK